MKQSEEGSGRVVGNTQALVRMWGGGGGGGKVMEPLIQRGGGISPIPNETFKTIFFAEKANVYFFGASHFPSMTMKSMI